MADDIGRSFRMRIALQAVRIQYRDSVRRLVFSPYNKFCNPPPQLRNFLSGNFLRARPRPVSSARSRALSQRGEPFFFVTVRPTSFNRDRAHFRHTLVPSSSRIARAVHLHHSHSTLSFLCSALSHAHPRALFSGGRPLC